LPYNLREESAFAAVALNEVYSTLFLIRYHNRNYEAWESPSGTEIYPNARLSRKPDKLCGVSKMALPKVRKGGWGYKVNGLLPLKQQALISSKLLDRFM